MDNNEISFENLPKAVAHLVNEVAEIKALVEKGQDAVLSPKRIPIGIDEACKIIGKAKPTIYTLVRKRLLPCYKNGKQLYFFEDELLEWRGDKLCFGERACSALAGRRHSSER